MSGGIREGQKLRTGPSITQKTGRTSPPLVLGGTHPGLPIISHDTHPGPALVPEWLREVLRKH